MYWFIILSKYEHNKYMNSKYFEIWHDISVVMVILVKGKHSECKNLLYHVTLLITILIRITYDITMSQKDDKKKRVTALFLSSFCYVIREYFLVFSRAI